MSALLELAARVEAATGSDRELDAAIATGIGKKARVKYGHPALGNEYSAPAYFERYTASIDSAMSLVPEGWEYSFLNGNGYDEAALTSHGIERTAWSSGNSLPLAICAAALRARASMMEAGNG